MLVGLVSFLCQHKGNLSTDDGNARDNTKLKNGFKFYSRISQVTEPVQSANLSKKPLKLNM